MARPIVFDLTHLQHRLAYEAPSGIDRVDLLYARHLSDGSGRAAAAAHYGNTLPALSTTAQLGDLVRRLDDRWRENTPLAGDAGFARLRAWLLGEPVPEAPPPAEARRKRGPKWHFDTKLRPFLRYGVARRPPPEPVPRNALYLNVAQHATEHPRFFAWLAARGDVRAVFFLHDLLPLDYPEFWWDGHEALFARRVEVMLRHAGALITSSASVRERALAELARAGRPAVPVLACPLPSPLEAADRAGSLDPDLAAVPYFVVLGTIEPRKNHMLLLNVWRRLAAMGGAVPRLVVVGRRGWENEQTIDMLERCPGLHHHVREVSDLSAPAVARLIANARALLMPSFAEGYGLPLVEALTLGTPVVASDIPVFREVTQGRAVLRDPVDGLGWCAAIQGLADPRSELSGRSRALAKAFEPPTTSGYFAAVDAFLDSL